MQIHNNEFCMFFRGCEKVIRKIINSLKSYYSSLNKGRVWRKSFHIPFSQLIFNLFPDPLILIKIIESILANRAFL